MGIDWNKINSILGSKAFENVAGVAGAGISAYAGSKGAATDAKQQAAQFAAQMALQQQTATENQRQGAATSAAAASPLGANEQFALRQGILRSVLPNLRNATATPGDPAVRAAMGSGVQGGFRLPTAGLPADALASLSPGATAGAISQRQGHIANIDPNAPRINFGRMGFDPSVAGPIQAETDAFQGAAGQRVGDQQSRTAEQLKMALDQNYAAANQPEKKKSGGILSKIGGVLKFAAPIAASFIPGVGPLAAAAIGGGGAALGTGLQGGGVGDIVRSGVTGGVASGVGRAATRGGQPGVPVQGPPAPFNQTQGGVNPQLLSAALRRQRFGG